MHGKNHCKVITIVYVDSVKRTLSLLLLCILFNANNKYTRIMNTRVFLIRHEQIPSMINAELKYLHSNTLCTKHKVVYTVHNPYCHLLTKAL